jgi:hypothetical protein
MGSEEAPLSPHSASRHRRRPPGDDAEEASSPKRQKRSHHRHRHGHGDRGDREGASRRSAAKPGEGEAEDGEILDDAAAAAARGDCGKAGLVFGGLAPAPVCSEPQCFALPLGIGYFRCPFPLMHNFLVSV